ncbi:hypothetical protein F5876DRAFT_73892 [Lentinula aff. lateritia]|uniref:Uncharacterized protein n=1 Tax=Lentinula aff. lateritia TaxID=2804960 RepID=A0ACC1U9U0_9AGAR|nr:hypothetical protein F5876DRAFT_73892 [Lentinula aff. lateritia]
MDEFRTCSGQLVGPHAPSELVEAIGHDTFADILEENIIVIDFGQSYLAPDPPKNYEPATLADYMPPETRFEERVGPETDMWQLGDAEDEVDETAASTMFKEIETKIDSMDLSLDTQDGIPAQGLITQDEAR